MKFKSEWGAILGPDDNILRLIEGGPGNVKFPQEIIWQLHKQRPGSVYTIAHTHPPGFNTLSTMDMTLFEAWAWALYPFPLRMSLITDVSILGYTRNDWLGQLESKESWLERGKVGARKFGSMRLDITSASDWEEILIDKSYG